MTSGNRILVVCRGGRAEAEAQAKSLAIDLEPYGTEKIGAFWGTVPRSQKINVAVWLLMKETAVIFYGDVPP